MDRSKMSPRRPSDPEQRPGLPARESFETRLSRATRHPEVITDAPAKTSGASSHDDEARSGADVDGWWIDVDHSNLEFSLSHIVVGQLRGRFTRWGGTVRLDVADVRQSTVRIWVDLASIDTGDRERDEQIRSPEFFDIARFPRAVFTSTQPQPPEGTAPLMTGSLELHGVKADVALEVTDQRSQRIDLAAPTMSLTIKTRLDRRRFGLRWNQDLDVGGVVVGDDVEVIARVELIRGRDRGRDRR